MYDNNQNNDNQVRWNGSTYSAGPYRMEDLRNVPPVTPPKPQKKKRGKGAVRVIALILACALIGGGAGFGGAALYAYYFPTEVPTTPPPVHSDAESTTLHENTTPPTTSVKVEQVDGLTPMSLSDIYKAYVNSCVVITCKVTYTTSSWYGPYSGTATSAGSGFVISDNGYIITNYHVIDNAEAIKVTFYDGTEYEAKYVGGEESNDLAVLKIEASGLTPVVLGDSDTLEVGATVSTIGNALGSLSFSQTSGAVSGLGRSVTYSDGSIISMIQTDCTINSGNSGGPLFDQYGRVVGITSAKYSNNADSSSAAIENIGFAIPINDVKNIVTDIMEHGYVIRPYMGVIVATVTQEYAQIFGWPYGAYVNSVEEDSCAAKAGIRKGDIITKVGDTEVTSNPGLTIAKNKYAPGDTVDVTVYRNGEEIVLSLTFDASENPTESEQAPAQTQRPQGNNQGGYSSYPYGNLFPFGF